MADGYSLGDMVKVKVKIYSKEGHHDGYKFAHGMITQIRNRSRIAYIDFLPIEDTANQWVTFETMMPRDGFRNIL